MRGVPPLSELLAAAKRTAVHLESRDVYTPNDEAFLGWMAGKARTGPVNPEWSDLVRSHVARGVQFYRARIVSEPLSDYIRFEHAVTDEVNVEAGEQVRWLPRRNGGLVRIPLNDFWIFDDRMIRFAHFAGNGELVEYELSEDPAVIKICVESFQAVWEIATPHARYRPR